MTKPTTPDANWLDDCPPGECRTEEIFDENGLAHRRIRDRRPIQHSDGYDLTIVRARTDTVPYEIDDGRKLWMVPELFLAQGRSRRWLDMSISELIAKAPPSTETEAFSHYMHTVRSIAQHMASGQEDKP